MQTEREREKKNLLYFLFRRAAEVNGDFCFVSGEGRGFALILSRPELGVEVWRGGVVLGVLCQEELLFTPTCRHGTFEAFVKRGIWKRATRVLSFTNSSLVGMTMLAAGPSQPLRKRDEIPQFR